MWTRAVAAAAASAADKGTGILVLAGVGGLFFWLYMSNRSSGPVRRLSDNQVVEQAAAAVEFLWDRIPTTGTGTHWVDLRRQYFGTQDYADSQADVDAVIGYLTEKGWVVADPRPDDHTWYTLNEKGTDIARERVREQRRNAVAPKDGQQPQ